ncbi:MAG: hypothetical protein M0Q91_11910 [Methanoregula sp.]|jgi:FtsZ-binding cell division protein ZapB|nr:hypothetical protein [Methanoregula sp.]
MILIIFGLSIGELVALFTFFALIIGAIVQLNVRIKGNEDGIKLVQETTDEKIEALKNSTENRINALEAGRKQNADNIETMRKENREDHKAIMDKLDSLLGYIPTKQTKRMKPT